MYTVYIHLVPKLRISICSPQAGDPKLFKKHFQAAKTAGLGVTLHIAEVSPKTVWDDKLSESLPKTEKNTSEDTLELLSYAPDRLGHATFLDSTTTALVHNQKICIEICLSSNLLCKTVQTLDAHHVRHHV